MQVGWCPRRGLHRDGVDGGGRLVKSIAKNKVFIFFAKKQSFNFLQTTNEGPVPNGEEGGRMVIGHRIPRYEKVAHISSLCLSSLRLLVLPGMKEWRVASVCSADCLNLMGEEAWGIDIVKVIRNFGTQPQQSPPDIIFISIDLIFLTI